MIKPFDNENVVLLTIKFPPADALCSTDMIDFYGGEKPRRSNKHLAQRLFLWTTELIPQGHSGNARQVLLTFLVPSFSPHHCPRQYFVLNPRTGLG